MRYQQLAALAVAAAVTVAAAASTPARADKGSVTIELSIQPIGAAPGAVLTEHGDAEVRFTVRDKDGSPVSGERPSAWINSRVDDKATCKAKIEGFINANVGGRPTVNLNAFFIVTMNDDASLHVIDPMLGYGGSKLLTGIPLASVPADWAAGADEKRIFVSMPAANRVAVVNTRTWRVEASIDAGKLPTRVRIQNDGRYVWVSSADPPGVAVIDALSLEVVARIPTGAGPHDIAFSEDDAFAFVTNAGAATVTVIDTRALVPLRSLLAGGKPVSAAWSNVSNSAYVAADTGLVSVLQPANPEPVARIQLKAGIRHLAIAPNGRWVFLANPVEDLVYVIDASTNKLLHASPLPDGPDQIIFTQQMAHIRTARSELVKMIGLQSVGKDAQLPWSEFSGGQRPHGATVNPVLAPSIVPAREMPGVLVANALDKTIYYYEEGMPAPMGSFKNYDRQARAAMVIDHSLREVQPGVYSTVMRVPAAGSYDAAFIYGRPPVYHCFETAVAPDPNGSQRRRLTLRPKLASGTVPAGRATIRVVATSDTGAPLPKLDELDVIVMNGAATWSHRTVARRIEGSEYAFDAELPGPGAYLVYVHAQSAGVRLNDIPPLILRSSPKN